MPHCPDGHTDQVIKTGSIHTGKQKYACNACGRHCVDDPHFRIISDETKALIDRLLLEKSRWRGSHGPSRFLSIGCTRMSTRTMTTSHARCAYAQKKAD
jgi:hypothetical protein